MLCLVFVLCLLELLLFPAQPACCILLCSVLIAGLGGFGGWGGWVLGEVFNSTVALFSNAVNNKLHCLIAM